MSKRRNYRVTTMSCIHETLLFSRTVHMTPNHHKLIDIYFLQKMEARKSSSKFSFLVDFPSTSSRKKVQTLAKVPKLLKYQNKQGQKSFCLPLIFGHFGDDHIHLVLYSFKKS